MNFRWIEKRPKHSRFVIKNFWMPRKIVVSAFFCDNDFLCRTVRPMLQRIGIGLPNHHDPQAIFVAKFGQHAPQVVASM